MQTSVFHYLDDLLFKRAHGLSRVVRRCRFSTRFRSYSYCMWACLGNDRQKLPINALRKHLLLALIFLKIYVTGHVNSLLTNADQKTFRIDSLGKQIVRITNRSLEYKRRRDRLSRLWKSSIRSIIPFPQILDSGFRYEIAVCIHSGEIVWCHAPFKCGSYPDLRIFRLKVKIC